MKKILSGNITLSILSGFILCIGWTQLGIGWATFIAFVPILIILERILKDNRKRKGLRFFGLCYISLFIWNVISTWWIYYATLAGAIAAIVISTSLMAVVMCISFFSFKTFGRRMGYITFIVNWIAFEYLFMNSQISWPWLILGNSFSNNISLIQWYEYVGHLGGSLWIMIINVMTYELLRQITLKEKIKEIRSYSIGLICLVFIPITFSLIRYHTYEERGKDIDIVIIQPNIDPYNEKFDNLKIEDQLNIILNEAYKVADKGVDYFIAPETAIPNYMWEDELNEDPCIESLRAFIFQYPDAKFIIGANTRTLYKNGTNKTKTSGKLGRTEHYADIFNTSLQIDTSDNILIYHKSKLVPGVEMMPYPKIFGFLHELMVDLGGMTGSNGTQEKRSVFPNNKLELNVGVPICYESAYGEFMSGFVNEGANVLFVITNDGWWNDTPGYKQHMSFSKLRAVESRRSIARSANTGISCFINQRGDILKELGWWKRGALREIIKANDKITFYTKYGDFIPRMALVFAIIIFVIQITNGIFIRIKNRNEK